MESEFKLPKFVIIFLSIVWAAGILVALYLTWLHYKVHSDPTFHSFCAMSDQFNCETVAESRYSVFLGLPVAVWGMFGYAVMFALTAAGVGVLKQRAAFSALLAASFLSVLASAALAVLSYCVICSFCVMCTVSYAINLLGFTTLVWQAIRVRLPLKEAIRELFTAAVNRWKALLGMILVLLLADFFYPNYWAGEHKAGAKRQQEGITEDGRYWIGAAAPSLVIEEYSDYICPHCRRAHDFQRRLLMENHDKVRLIHRHFPLDNACNPLVKSPFHPGACILAAAANCAGKQGKFWEMNDLLYKSELLAGSSWEAKAEDAARKAGLDAEAFRRCLASAEVQAEVRADIENGLQLKLRGTPSFVIDGEIHVGVIDPQVFTAHGVSQPAR